MGYFMDFISRELFCNLRREFLMNFIFYWVLFFIFYWIFRKKFVFFDRSKLCEEPYYRYPNNIYLSDFILLELETTVLIRGLSASYYLM